MSNSLENTHKASSTEGTGLRSDVIATHTPYTGRLTPEGARHRYLWLVFALGTALIIITALVQAWATRYAMNEDGISYLEIASAYAHHSWASAINAYWNPLYPALLALALPRSASGADFVAAHVVNFFIFIGSFFCFQFFWAELLRMQRILFPASVFSEAPPWVWHLLGYSLFFSCSLDLITLTLVTPDLLISALVFAVMGLLLRIRRLQGTRPEWPSFLLLGILLGLGYLTKPIMLPFGMVVIATICIVKWREKLPLRNVALTLIAFALLAGPYINLISRKVHRFTISDNGSLTYLSVVNELPYGYPHGTHLPTGTNLKHPPRILFDKPAVYEFATPVPGSCPIWYDPSYWYEGIKARFSPAGQVRQIIKNVITLSHTIFIKQAPLCIALFALLLAVGNSRNLLRGVFKQWVLIVPAGALVLTIMVFKLQPRLIAPFVTILWACFLGAIRPRVSEEGTRLLKSLLVAAASLLVIGVISQVGTDAANARRGISTETAHSTSEDRVVAAGLREIGVPNNASVAYVGDSISAYWAHLAGLRIVAEVPIEDGATFLNAKEDTMKSVLQALASTGAAAVVAGSRPTIADNGWQRVPGTDYYVHFLHR